VHPCLLPESFSVPVYQLTQLLGLHRVGRLHAEILRALGFGEGNDVAQTVTTGQHEAESVETEGKAPWGGAPVSRASSINPKRSRACASL
jgi:hypothetical protein